MDRSESSSSSASHQQPVSHWFRLFVGWVPRQFTEANLKPIFDRSGEVKDIIILKDKVSGQPKGCAFVSYATEAEAERAIADLDRKIQLPGASSPMEVRFARSHQYIQAGTGPQDNRQLFFSRAPLSATESDLRETFAQFGTVEEVNIFSDRKTNMSKGCGFITMASRDQAVRAIEALNENCIMQGAVTTLAVKWADPDLQSKKKKAVEEANSEKRVALNAHKDSPALFPSMDGHSPWDGVDPTKWMDLQKKHGDGHSAAGHVRMPQQNRNPSGGRIGRPANSNTFCTMPHGMLGAQPHPVRRLDYTHDVPPLGCQPDAIKLFVGNIPKTYTAEDLRPLFDQIGTVIELVVVRDKLTDESKGSAFVWYQTRAEAEHAVSELHLRHMLHDPTGEQDRPLVVRRANPKVPPLLLHTAPVVPAAHLAPVHVHSSFSHPSAMMDSSLEFPEHLQGSLFPDVLGVDLNPSASISKLSNEFNSMGLQQLNSVRKAAPVGEQCLGSKGQDSLSVPPDLLELGVQDLLQSQVSEAASIPQRSSLDYLNSDAFSSALCASSAQVGGSFQGLGVNQPTASMRTASLQNMYVGQMTLALPVSPQQGSIVGANLHTIQAGSGALIQLAPGSNDSYVVMLSGTESQVNRAKSVVQDLIGSGMS